MKLIALFYLFAFSLQASVWQNRDVWSIENEQKYKSWIKTTFNKNIFVKGRYKGIETDCADAVYAARAIFAYENNLPFVIKNTLGGRLKTISNNTQAFDDIEKSDERFIAFINNLGHQVSTISLAFYDTFPVSLENINAGDTYVTVNPNQSRHAYLIRDTLKTGNFSLLASTVPKRARRLISETGSPGPLFPASPYGFKRFKWPKYVKDPSLKVEKELGAGENQYELRESYSRHSDYFSALTKIIRKRSESFKEYVNRELKNLLSLFEARVEVVDSALEYQKKIGNRCFNEFEFDEYSTPSRDKRIINRIDTLLDKFSEVKDSGVSYKLKRKTELGLNFLLGEEQTRISQRKAQKLLKFNVAKKTKVNLADFYLKYKNGEVSSDPNDNFFSRWGIENEGSDANECGLEQQMQFGNSKAFYYERMTHLRNGEGDTYVLKEDFTPKGRSRLTLFKLDHHGFGIKVNFDKKLKSFFRVLSVERLSVDGIDGKKFVEKVNGQEVYSKKF